MSHFFFLNLVYVNDPAYVAKEIIGAAMKFISKGLQVGKKVLVHCNQGESRGSSIGLVYFVVYTNALPKTSLKDSEAKFIELYALYTPKSGMMEFLRENWRKYVRKL